MEPGFFTLEPSACAAILSHAHHARNPIFALLKCSALNWPKLVEHPTDGHIHLFSFSDNRLLLPNARREGEMQIDGGKPTNIAELEGRLVVLEIVAMTSLALVIGVCDEGNAHLGRNVLYLIRDAVANKCEELALSNTATSAATTYVEELLQAAAGSLFPNGHE
jgi:hypothetical protein